MSLLDELKRRSWINEAANSAAEEDFSQAIRQALPGFDTSDYENN